MVYKPLWLGSSHRLWGKMDLKNNPKKSMKSRLNWQGPFSSFDHSPVNSALYGELDPYKRNPYISYSVNSADGRYAFDRRRGRNSSSKEVIRLSHLDLLWKCFYKNKISPFISSITSLFSFFSPVHYPDGR
jgi:hypothetical protein